jgi:hypothetical protein
VGPKHYLKLIEAVEDKAQSSLCLASSTQTAKRVETLSIFDTLLWSEPFVESPLHVFSSHKVLIALIRSQYSAWELHTGCCAATLSDVKISGHHSACWSQVDT